MNIRISKSCPSARPATTGSASRRSPRNLLREHPNLIGLYNAGGGTRGIIAALEKASRDREVVFIAHELTDHARKALIKGTIDAIIDQDAGHEVRSAVRVLMAKADNAPLIAAQERIRIDIFLRDNLP